MWPSMWDTVYECFNDAIISNDAMNPSTATPAADASATTAAAVTPSEYKMTDKKFWPPRYSKEMIAGTPKTMDGMTNWYLM